MGITTEKKRGLYLKERKIDVTNKRAWKHKTGRGFRWWKCWREPTQWRDGERQIAEELHLWSQRRVLGGWVGTWMGGIYHYWLEPPSHAQSDIPLTIDINHDFSIIDPPFHHGREHCGVHIDFSLSSLLLPTFRLSTVMHNDYQTLLMWNLRDAIESLFLHSFI